MCMLWCYTLRRRASASATFLKRKKKESAAPLTCDAITKQSLSKLSTFDAVVGIIVHFLSAIRSTRPCLCHLWRCYNAACWTGTGGLSGNAPLFCANSWWLTSFSSSACRRTRSWRTSWQRTSWCAHTYTLFWQLWIERLILGLLVLEPLWTPVGGVLWCFWTSGLSTVNNNINIEVRNLFSESTWRFCLVAFTSYICVRQMVFTLHIEEKS